MTLIRTCVVPGCRGLVELEPDAYACPDCQRSLVRKLGEIETYLSIASIFEQPGRHGDGGPTAKGFESQPPLNLDVVVMLDPRTEINGSSGAEYEDGIDHDVVDELPNIGADLGGWYRVLVEEHPDWDGATWDGEAIAYADGAAVLRSRCDWIARQSWVDDFARDVLRVHHALRVACSDLPPDALGQCITTLATGECRGDVYPTSGHDGARCSRCHRLYTGTDLLRLNAAQVVAKGVA